MESAYLNTTRSEGPRTNPEYINTPNINHEHDVDECPDHEPNADFRTPGIQCGAFVPASETWPDDLYRSHDNC